MNFVILWIYSLINILSPADLPQHIALEGSPSVTQERYMDIANDVYDVVYNPNTKLLYKGPFARERTVVAILVIMKYESSFLANVDYGSKRGDHGRSWCLMQIMAGNPPGRTSKWNFVKNRAPSYLDPAEEIRDGYLGQQLVDNRQLCIEEGLRIARISFHSCGKDSDKRLALYSSGSCSKGRYESSLRMKTIHRLWVSQRKEVTWDGELITEYNINQKPIFLSNTPIYLLKPSLYNSDFSWLYNKKTFHYE